MLRIWSGSVPPPIFIGTIDLKSSSEYVHAGKSGTYKFDAATQHVTWTSGPAKDNSYDGKYEIDRKTHKSASPVALSV